MKRSEMIQNIASELVCEQTNHISWDKAQEVAERVLARIEKDGMTPPPSLKPIPYETYYKYPDKVRSEQYPLVPGDFKDDNGIWCTPGYHGWEKE